MQLIPVTVDLLSGSAGYFHIPVMEIKTSTGNQGYLSVINDYLIFPSTYQHKCNNAGVENKEAYHIKLGKLLQLTTSVRAPIAKRITTEQVMVVVAKGVLKLAGSILKKINK